MLLGMGNVGKSGLFRRCFMNERIDPSKEGHNPTHDVALRAAEQCKWQPSILVDGKNQPVNLRVWDFGGQLVLHGVHESFLEDDGKTIYVLVLDASRVPGNGTGQTDATSGNRIDYWLKTLVHFAGASVTAIIAITKCDLYPNATDRPVDEPMPLNPSQSIIQYDVSDLSIHFKASVKALVDQCSAASSLREHDHAIERLRSEIEAAVANLKEVHNLVPPQFLPLIQMVRDKCLKCALFTLTEYQSWCNDPSIDVTDVSMQEGLLRALHFSGELFYFGKTEAEKQALVQNRVSLGVGRCRVLMAKPDHLLENFVFAPQHLKDCVYEIVRQSESTSNQGWFKAERIDQFVTKTWTAAGLADSLHKQHFGKAVRAFLGYVQLSWFDEQRQQYLFPRGLGPGSPSGSSKWPTRRLDWEFLPEANFHRFMVYLHSREQVVFEESRWQHWRYAILAHHPLEEGTRLLLSVAQKMVG